MSFTLAFRRIARIEFDQDANLYERKRKGLGARFVRAVNAVLDRISDQPDFYPEVHGNIREAILSKYPYSIYYVVDPQAVIVLSVFHTSRDPAIWQNRV